MPAMNRSIAVSLVNISTYAAAAGLFLSLSAGLWGCGGSSQKTKDGLELIARKLEPLKRQKCDGDQEQLVDVNNDGIADLRHVFDGGKAVCDEIDLNFDGRIDLTRSFGKDGKVQYEQYDLDFDGKLDQQSFYENGQLSRKELDTNFDRMIDTWVFCQGAY